MSELIECVDNLTAEDIVRRIAKTANGTPFYLQTEGGISFDPADLPDLILRLDAALGITVVTGVSEWQDQSPSLNHMLQPTGNLQPAYTASDALMNGNPTVMADGLDDWMDFTTNPTIANFSIIGVLHSTGPGFWFANDFSGVHYINHQASVDTFRSSVISAFNFANDPTSPILLEFYRTGSAMTAWKNGIASADNPKVNGTAFTPRALFRRTTTYAATIVGDIIISSSEFSAENKTAVRTYLATKYAITLP